MFILLAVQHTDVVVSAGEGDQDHGRGVEGRCRQTQTSRW